MSWFLRNGVSLNGIESIEEAKSICDAAGIDPYKTVKEIQPIAF